MITSTDKEKALDRLKSLSMIRSLNQLVNRGKIPQHDKDTCEKPTANSSLASPLTS